MSAGQARHQDHRGHTERAGHLDRVVDDLILLLARGRMELISVGGQRAQRQSARCDLADELSARLLRGDQCIEVGVGSLRPVAGGDLDRGQPEMLGQVERRLKRQVADRVCDQSDLHGCLIPNGRHG